jgi:hypothetical protein
MDYDENGQEEKYVSLDTALELKDAGFPQGITYGFWLKTSKNGHYFETMRGFNYRRPSGAIDAPDLDEMFKALPSWIDSENQRLSFVDDGGSVSVGYRDDSGEWRGRQRHERLLEALARLWLWCVTDAEKEV